MFPFCEVIIWCCKWRESWHCDSFNFAVGYNEINSIYRLHNLIMLSQSQRKFPKLQLMYILHTWSSITLHKQQHFVRINMTQRQGMHKCSKLFHSYYSDINSSLSHIWRGLEASQLVNLTAQLGLRHWFVTCTVKYHKTSNISHTFVGNKLLIT